MSTTVTLTRVRSIEPFPTFIDHYRPSSPQPYNSKITTTLSNIEPKNAIAEMKRRASISNIVSNHIRLRYYQYEVTFGLYMLTPNEKLVLNTIILSILSGLLYGFIFGLEPFLVRCFCRILYLSTGGVEGAEELCAGTNCD